MMKLLDKERKKKKEVKPEKMETEEDLPKKDKEIITGDLVVNVKVKTCLLYFIILSLNLLFHFV